MDAQDDMSDNIKKLDAELAKKTSDLNAFIFQLTGRIKAVEDENATDKEDGDIAASKENLDATIKVVPQNTEQPELNLNFTGEPDTAKEIDLQVSAVESVHT